MMIVIATAATILLSRTTFGRYVYATGGNPQAARLGGVRANAIRVATFALSGRPPGSPGPSTHPGSSAPRRAAASS